MTVDDRDLSDVELARAAAAAVGTPRVGPADSFVLHAPLEIEARLGLLPFVVAGARPRARELVTEVARRYVASGPGLDLEPRPRRSSPPAAAAELVTAIDAGDLDAVDVHAATLGAVATVSELRTLLAGALLPRLAAAGHAPIYLHLLPRVAPRGELPGGLLRPLARELARQPSWRIGWIDERPPAEDSEPGDVFAALAATPLPPAPAGLFIHPTMAAVDGADTSARLGAVLGAGSDVAARARQVLRAAAWSMLLEPPDFAPYTWTHCLTMPLAVLDVAADSGDALAALAVAMTHVAGFRASAAQRPLVPWGDGPEDWAAPSRESLGESLGRGPGEAAAAAWHAAATGDGALVGLLATRAATHHDAHYVKYTLACLDAAAADPTCRPLYLAAAAHLAGYWATNPGAGFDG